MTGCKHTHWKLLGALAAIAVLIPRLAVGEFGVCPPYSQTFGPGDPPEDIVAFMNSASTRPGGATAKLMPGEYFLEGLTEITGVLCVEGLVEQGGPPVAIGAPRVNPPPARETIVVANGGILTVRSVATTPLAVRSDAMLFANDYVCGTDLDDDPILPGGVVVIDAGAFAQFEDFQLPEVFNAGTLLLNQGTVYYPEDYGGAALENEGFAVLDQTRVSGYASDKFEVGLAGIANSGVVTLIRSTITEVIAESDDYDYDAPGTAEGLSNSATGVAYVVSSTIAANGGFCEDVAVDNCGTGIVNDGGLVEISQSVVADNSLTDCTGVLEDKGYNVFVPGGGCIVTDPTSVEDDPLLAGVELGAGSPAIDLIPLDLCEPVDHLGRARTDGDGDGMIECDAGALEFGYVGLEVDVRTTPYWKQVGAIDLATENTLFVAVFSDAHVDATTIDFDSIYVEDFDARVRGPAYGDKDRDGLPDLVFWYRLDRDLDLDCGVYDQRFEALTGDGQTVFGQLRFEATGCVP